QSSSGACGRTQLRREINVKRTTGHRQPGGREHGRWRSHRRRQHSGERRHDGAGTADHRDGDDDLDGRFADGGKRDAGRVGGSRLRHEVVSKAGIKHAASGSTARGVSASGPRARIMVATPTYTGELTHRYVDSLMAATVFGLYH